MSGEIAPVMQRTWKEVWQPLARSNIAPPDMFNELLGELSDEPTAPPAPEIPPPNAFDENGVLIDQEHVEARAKYDRALEIYAAERSAYEVAVAGGDARPLFKALIKNASRSEPTSVAFIENAHDILGNYGEALQGRFRELVLSFIGNHNIGYAVDDAFRFHPSLSAMFTRLMREMREKSAIAPHTAQMFGEFEEALFDLRHGRTQTRLKACLSRQFHLLEALGRQCPGVNGQTLGEICNQLQWPHVTIKEVGRKLSGFRNDFPGIAHAGNAAAPHLSTKDYVSISLMLASISPYFLTELDGEKCYGG